MNNPIYYEVQNMKGRELDELCAIAIGLKPQIDFGKWDQHIWQTDEEGNIDYCAYENHVHNGPKCTRCGYFYCVLCDEVPKRECIIHPPKFSSHLQVAWKLLIDPYIMNEYQLGLVPTSFGQWICRSFSSAYCWDIVAQAETAPLAITRARVLVAIREGKL